MNYPWEYSEGMELTSDEIIAIMSEPTIKVVSFDIFDTLLVRPSIEPKDIFYLLQKPVFEKYGLDFVNLRLNAEDELNNEFATIEEIWSSIATRNKISLFTAQQLMKMELSLEKDLLKARFDVKQIYDAALQQGKRVVATSDMYIPKDILREILDHNGYENIQDIYVSCEQKARKSTGELFDLMLEHEKKQAFEVMHIGDNFETDYKKALKKGICAIYYPSVWNVILGENTAWKQKIKDIHFYKDPFVRLLLSFSFLYKYNTFRAEADNNRYYSSIEDMTVLLLAPIMVQIALDMLNSPAIQKNYDTIYFAARDGYLPQKIYDILSTGKKHIPSKYIYVSRRALSYVTYKDFFDYFSNCTWESYYEYPLEKFVMIYFGDQKKAKEVLDLLSESQRKLDLVTNPIGCLEALRSAAVILNTYFSQQKQLSQEYYYQQIGKTKRILVFDLGYSGSVSEGLGRAFMPPKKVFVDKYYLAQTAQNVQKDEKNGTKTFCLYPDGIKWGINIVLEECFSPLEGSCIGFQQKDNQIKPLLGETPVDDFMQRDMQKIEKIATDYSSSFMHTFNKYCQYFIFSNESNVHNNMAHTVAEVIDPGAVLVSANWAFIESPYQENYLLKNISFIDSNAAGKAIPLSDKLSRIFESLHYYQSEMQGTAFINPDLQNNNASVIPSLDRKQRIGIHIHLYNEYLLQEFIRYLKIFPAHYDLFISIVEKRKLKPVLKTILNKQVLPNLDKLTIIEMENRGRDVMPWLIGTREYQNNYELFCHLHSKESSQYGGEIGTQWRHYLLDNLLGKKAFTAISNIFTTNQNVGCVFPNIYPDLANIFYHGTPLMGETSDNYRLMEKYLSKLGIESTIDRGDLLFSVGTMLWYRPDALKPLFNSTIQINDFPKEPIPFDGTLAHAIERMIPFAAKSQGYKVRMYNTEASERWRALEMQRLVQYGGNIYGNVQNDEQFSVSLYLDYGRGFSEEIRYKKTISIAGGAFDATFQLEDQKKIVRGIRFDPGDRGGIVLENVSVNISFKDGTTDILSLKQCRRHNGIKRTDNNTGLVFHYDDPQIIWKINVKKGIASIRFNGFIKAAENKNMLSSKEYLPALILDITQKARTVGGKILRKVGIQK